METNPKSCQAEIRNRRQSTSRDQIKFSGEVFCRSCLKGKPGVPVESQGFPHAAWARNDFLTKAGSWRNAMCIPNFPSNPPGFGN